MHASPRPIWRSSKPRRGCSTIRAARRKSSTRVIAFPRRIDAALRRIVSATTIFDEQVFRLGDGLAELPFSGVSAYPNEPLGDALVASLAERLYERYHCAAAGGARRTTDMLPALRAANASRGGWSVGWTVRERDADGTAVVVNGSRTRLVAPGDYRPDRAGAGETVELRRPSDDAQLQPDFYYARGEALAGRYDELVGARVYLNLAARGSAGWVERLTSELNEYAVPFSLKVLRYAELYGRVDAGVVYVPRRHAGFVAALS